jgi:hypothetical protein
MKIIKYLILLLIFCIGITAFSQPGSYYPPPANVDYHNDTLTICPPDSLPGEPVILIAYNIYVDSVFYINVEVTDPGATIAYFLDHESILPGMREFCVYTVYNQWISEESTCDTATLIYGNDLPFLEDWSSGNFEEQQWILTSGNWAISTGEGNPAPAAEFTGYPVQADYAMSLESYPINALGMTEGKIWLDFNLKLDDIQPTGNEWLRAQVWNWSNQVWTTVADYRNDDGSFNWTSEHINIKARAMNKVFRIRFLAMGVNSADIQGWSVDNVHIYRKCDGPYEFDLYEHLDYNELQWYGPDGCWIDEWIHWDDGQNSGNSIGLGDTLVFDVAARWTPAQLAPYHDVSIYSIAFFPAEGQAIYSVRVWTGAGPDTLIVDQPVTAPLMNQWNYVNLTTPMPLDITKELWVGYHISTPTGYPAGVDDGPGIDGYGNMMYYQDVWQTLIEINPNLNYNWNIACHLIGNNSTGTDLYFNLYRETNQGGFQFCGTTHLKEFLDSNIVLSDVYCYKLTAVWCVNGDTCESEPTNPACEYLMLGTDQPEPDKVLRIYPNPANDWLNIEAEEEIGEIRVYNPLGERVLKLEIGNSDYQIDVSRLQGGIYYVAIITENREIKKKIIILR